MSTENVEVDVEHHREFYEQFFASLEQQIGRIDTHTIVSIAGFDMGGPLNFCTIGALNGSEYTTYVSCELALCHEQLPGEHGRYELLTSCDDERWARSILSEIGRMSLDVAFGDGHTLDIGAWVDEGAPIQGVLFEEILVAEIADKEYSILRCIGITRGEMEYALEHGSDELIARLQNVGVYPHTTLSRVSVI